MSHNTLQQSWITIKSQHYPPKKSDLGPVHLDWISDKLDYISQKAIVKKMFAYFFNPLIKKTWKILVRRFGYFNALETHSERFCLAKQSFFSGRYELESYFKFRCLPVFNYKSSQLEWFHPHYCVVKIPFKINVRLDKAQTCKILTKYSDDLGHDIVMHSTSTL